MSEDTCSHLGFCTNSLVVARKLILFSSLVYLSKYMNNTGLLDWMILDSANVYKGFENINYARLKRCKLLAVHYVL